MKRRRKERKINYRKREKEKVIRIHIEILLKENCGWLKNDTIGGHAIWYDTERSGMNGEDRVCTVMIKEKV